MVLGNVGEPFNLQESYDYYVLGESKKYGKTNSYPTEPIAWWKYIKACVEVYETAAGYRGKRLGFFSESKKLTEEISNDWCREELGIDYDTLFDLADTNFCCD